MSRSYKKFPKIKVHYGKSGKYSKNQANRKIRRLPLDCDIPNGRGFKKLYESCEIWDYSYTQFKEWEIQDWEKDEADIINEIYTWKKKYRVTLEEAFINWKRAYLSK